MTKIFVILGAGLAFLAVVLGAFGAHGLQDRLSKDLMVIFQTAVQYHMYHALGLILIGLLMLVLPPSTWLTASGWFLFSGVLIFSGSLYVLSITGIKWLGAITPIGGLAFLIGWILVIVAVLRT